MATQFGNCKTCMKWKGPLTPDGWGNCLVVGSTRGVADEPASLAVAYDLAAKEAGLLTKWTFGCVQYKPLN